MESFDLRCNCSGTPIENGRHVFPNPSFVTPNQVLAKRAITIAWDVSAWGIASLAMVAARYDLLLTRVQWGSVLVYALIAAILQITLGLVVRIYLGRFRIGSFEEAVRLAGLVAATGSFTGLVCIVALGTFPRGIAIMVPPLVLVLMAAGRWAYRALFHHQNGTDTPDARQALIYGAGDAGAQLLAQLQAATQRPYIPVGLIDDDRSNRHRQLAGLRVVGTGESLLEDAHRLEATVIILAIPSAGKDFVRRLTERVETAGLKLVVVPPIEELIGGRVHLDQLHEVKIEDLLGRRTVQTDLSKIAGYLSGRRVLVTGAGGSIGSEIARQLHRFGPSELILLNRDESALHGVQLVRRMLSVGWRRGHVIPVDSGENGVGVRWPRQPHVPECHLPRRRDLCPWEDTAACRQRPPVRQTQLALTFCL